MAPETDQRRRRLDRGAPDDHGAAARPQDGCPWDLEQTFATIAPYTIEEAYEVADAIERGNLSDLKEELGDLLLQVVFHAQMARELGAFDFGDVVQAIVGKMVRRHPHVFGEADARTAEEQTLAWEEIKVEGARRQGRLGRRCWTMSPSPSPP